MESYAAWLAVVCSKPECAEFQGGDIIGMHRATQQLVVARGNRPLQLIEIGPPSAPYALRRLSKGDTDPNDTREHAEICAAAARELNRCGIRRWR